MKFQFYKSIGAKIFIIVMFCLILAIAGNSIQNGKTFYYFLKQQINQDTILKAKSSASSIESQLDNYASQISIAMHSLLAFPENFLKQAVQSFVYADKEYVSFQIILQNGKAPLKTTAIGITSNLNDVRFMDKSTKKLFLQLKKDSESWVRSIIFSPNSRKNIYLKSQIQSLHLPLLTIAMPFEINGTSKKYWALLTVWETKIISSLPLSKTIKSSLITLNKKIFTSPSRDITKHPYNFLNLSIVQKALSKTSPHSGFKSWGTTRKSQNTLDKLLSRVGLGNQNMLGAYSKITPYNLAVIVISDGSLAYQYTLKVILKGMLFAALFLLIGILVSYLGTSGIINNIKELARATYRIANGDFNSKIAINSSDEIAILGHSVNNMSYQIGQLLSTKVEMAKIEKEIETASMVQDTFFPTETVKSGPLNLVAQFRPASQCGGDWWGHYPLNEDKDLIFIADATGHGVGAALITAMIFSLSTLLAQLINEKKSSVYSLKDILTEFNTVLYKAGRGALTMTFFALIIDKKEGTLTFANSGHNFPLLLPEDQNDDRFIGPNKVPKFKLKKGQVTLRSPSNPLGLSENQTYKEESLPLKGGDKLFLFTDGIFECSGPNGTQWGKKNFINAISDFASQDAETFKTSMLSSAFNHFQNVPPDDDITVVVIEMDKAWQTSSAPTTEDPPKVEEIDDLLPSLPTNTAA